MTPGRCDAEIRDANGQFPRLWGRAGFISRGGLDPPCWGNAREAGLDFLQAAEAEASAACNQDWYYGVDGLAIQAGPNSPTKQPALLGVHQDIDFLCAHMLGRHREPIPFNARAEWCSRAGYQSLFPQYHLQGYSMCRQFQWTMCAARGLLPGQRDNVIVLATAPREARVTSDGKYPLGSCNSYTPEKGCGRGLAYSSADVFYLQICLLSAVCKNFFQLFVLRQGEEFRCILSDSGAQKRFEELNANLVDTPPAGEERIGAPDDDDDDDSDDDDDDNDDDDDDDGGVQVVGGDANDYIDDFADDIDAVDADGPTATTSGPTLVPKPSTNVQFISGASQDENGCNDDFDVDCRLRRRLQMRANSSLQHSST